ncbi:MAG: lactate/malate dehydrogenase family protein [Phycisphaerae bacterium]|nr:lactate/malate dehydrogenase family protein [Phycisphaerae bacterium]
MKVSIIGGGGRVGSNAAYALQCAGLVNEIALVDANADVAAGEALDLLHGSSLAGDQRIYATDNKGVADSDIICITAGLRRKPDESRLDLINRNVTLYKGILDSLRSVNVRKDAVFLVVSNPVDILTRLNIEYLTWPEKQVLGLGTVLDTTRFRSLIAAARNLPPTQVDALILGEHGDTMTPIWSSATVAGMALTKLLTPPQQADIFSRTQKSGAEVIRLKGGAGYAVGLSIARVIHAIALDQKLILPVSSRINGTYGIRKVCLSLPTVVGRQGVEAVLEPELWPKEIAGLTASARTLEETWTKISGK